MSQEDPHEERQQGWMQLDELGAAPRRVVPEAQPLDPGQDQLDAQRVRHSGDPTSLLIQDVVTDGDITGMVVR